MHDETFTHDETTRTRDRSPLWRWVSYVATAALALFAGVVGTLLAPRLLHDASRHDAVASSAHQGMSHGAGDDQPPSTETSGVYIPAARQQLIGVRSALVERRSSDTSIRTVGTLVYDETRVTMVHIKVAGWVERVYVDSVGRSVKKGEPLFDLYSPELVSTQTEYLLALRGHEELGGVSLASTRGAIDALLDGARERLRLWDISEAQIAELERTRQARRTLTLEAPFDGIVLERDAVPGQYLSPEMSAYRIADLSRIWAIGEVFEYELPLIRLGQEVEISLPYGPADRRLRGRIDYVYPEIDPQTRRARVRVELPNPGLALKPDTFVTFSIRARGAETLVIPKEAVIDTGVTRYAILAHPNGYFEPRDIEVGPPRDDVYPVLASLHEGDRVVTSAQFLIDSETNLQAAMQSMMGMHDMGAMGKGTEPHDMGAMGKEGELHDMGAMGKEAQPMQSPEAVETPPPDAPMSMPEHHH